MRTLLALLLFAIATPGMAVAAPWDGPRVIHDGADPDAAFALHPVPGAFTVTWAPGPQDSWPDDLAAPDRPDVLQVDRWRLERDGPVGATRLHTDRYRLVGAEAPEPGAVARALAALPDVVVAAPLMRLGRDAGPWRAVTPKILLQLRDPFDEAAMWDLADRLGLVVDGPRGLAPDQWRLLVPAGADVDPVEAAALLHDSPITRWAQVSWINERVERFVPDDPQFGDQWHLDNTGQAGGTAGNDVNGPEAWDLELGSADIVVAILDSGVDIDHPDLAEHLVAGWDFISGDDNPDAGGSSHGTSCAGVAAAPAQGIGVVGACPDCLIMPIRMLGADDETEADAVDWALANGADVINNSWGPTDGTGIYTPISSAMAVSVDNAVGFGRDGLGVGIFWAAGNGHPVDTCDLDGFVAYPSTFAVAASSNLGLRSSYSERCAELDFTAPSSGGSNGTAGITTTNIDGYTGSFGGTSAASPLAAGVGALVLSALPDLSWDGLRTVLQNSATKIDTDGGAYDASGHSTSYGYGRVDALAALQTEIAFLIVPASQTTCHAQIQVTVQIPTMPGLGSVLVTASSDTEGDPETFTLPETADGIYSGPVVLDDGAPVTGDGLLAVSDEDTITISSPDVGDSSSVDVDCRAPQISNPRVEELTHWGALLVWDTDEVADGHADWGVGVAEDLEFELTHQVWALDLEPCTPYSAHLSSSDVLGNTATVDNALGFTTPGNFADLPDDVLEGADPCDPSTWYPETGDDDDAGDDDDEPRTPPGNGLVGSGDGCKCASADTPPGSGAWLLLLLGLVARRSRERG